MTTEVDKLEVTEEEEEAFRCIRATPNPTLTEADVTKFMQDLGIASEKLMQRVTSAETKARFRLFQRARKLFRGYIT